MNEAGWLEGGGWTYLNVGLGEVGEKQHFRVMVFESMLDDNGSNT